MTCPRQIVQSMQIGDADKVNGTWFVQFSIVLADGTEGRVFRRSCRLSDLVNKSGKAHPIDGLHFDPPKYLFTKFCKECKE